MIHTHTHTERTRLLTTLITKTQMLINLSSSHLRDTVVLVLLGKLLLPFLF